MQKSQKRGMGRLYIMLDNFAIFIITHKRPSAQHTYNALMACNYTGKVYFVLDDTDPTIQEYIDKYGVDNILVFDKNHYINSADYDNGDNKAIYASAVYARRAVEDMAISLQLKNFVMADDDILDFVIRYPIDGSLKRFKITDFDRIIEAYLEILDCGVACVGFGRANSYFGGAVAFSPENMNKRVIVTNFFIRNASIPVSWSAWTFEDDITVLQSSLLGELWLSIPYVQQVPSEFTNLKGNGGNVELYQQNSRFEGCFTELKYMPSQIQIKCADKNNVDNVKNTTLLRHVNKCYQKIISSSYRKER